MRNFEQYVVPNDPAILDPAMVLLCVAMLLGLIPLYRVYATRTVSASTAIMGVLIVMALDVLRN